MPQTSLDVDTIASKLTLDEKIQLLAGADFWRTVPFPAKGVPYIKVTDGPNGARGGGDIQDSQVSAALFPAPICLGATWDVELAELMGKGIAQDSRSKQAHVSLAPTINIQRDPRGGRSFESYSEDPILSGDLGAAWITGCQGEGILATPKHFIANECEDKRRTVSSHVEEAPLREIYLRPFQRVLRNLRAKNLDGPGCLMTSYNRLNGVSCSHNERLLGNILREEWGFDGLVMSDWFGTYSTDQAIKAGLDLEMPGPTVFRASEKVHEALKAGKITEADIDDRACRVIELISKIGERLHNHSPSLEFLSEKSEEKEVSLQNEEISKSIRTIAAEGMVLLRNQNNLLPLEPTKKDGPKKIAFIGAPAKEAIQSGGGSANLTAQYKTSPLDGFKDVLKELGASDDVEVVWSNGCQLHTAPPPPTAEQLGNNKVTLEWYNGTSTPAEDKLFTTTESDAPNYTIFTPLPEGLEQTFALRVKFPLTPKTTGLHNFGIQAYGRSTLRVGSENFEFESMKDPFEYLVSMGKQLQMRQVQLEAGKTVQVEFDYMPHVLPISLSNGPFAEFRIGFEEYYDDDEALNNAVQTAKDADLAIVFTATGKEYETEGFDREHIQLPRRQNDLVEAILKVQPSKTVVVNLTGSAVELPWIDRAPAVVQAWFPGQECGRAIADVLLGNGAAGCASGRMPSTWPKKIEDHPSYGNFPGKDEGADEGIVVRYTEGRLVGHKWYEEKEIEPLFWFGYGLSYTTWKREIVSVAGSLTPEGGQATVNVRIENTGNRVGKDVVQLYIKPTSHADGRPKRTLAAFTKVTLNPGESKVVALQLDQEAVSYWDQGENGHWRVDQGSYEIVLATSSNPKDEVASETLVVEQNWTWNGVGLTN